MRNGPIHCLLLFAAAHWLNAPTVSAQPADNLFPAESRWETVSGATKDMEGGAVALQPGTGLKRSLDLPAGLYELQVLARGSGMMILNAGRFERTLPLTSDEGLYGLTFPVTEAETQQLMLSYEAGSNEQLQIRGTALVPADAERAAAWDAAGASFELLGYFGNDPQRPAPGDRARTAPVNLSAEDLARWEITETVIYYDELYDTHWIDKPAEVAQFYTRRGIPAKTAVEAEKWLHSRSRNDQGTGSSIIFAMGIAPANIVYPPFKDCLLADYLRAGGRVVWMANVPMYVSQDAVGPTGTYGTEPAEQLLGLAYDRKTFYGMEGPVTITRAGEVWGLEPGLSLTRPAVTRTVTVPFVTDSSGKFCGAGMVNLRGNLPLSGFIFVPNAVVPTDEALLRNVYRLARYSGKPIAIPEPLPPPAPALPVEAQLHFGNGNRRLVYLRNEIVPLALHLRTLRPEATNLQVRYQLREDADVLRSGTCTVTATDAWSEHSLGFLDLNGLRAGRYTVSAMLAGESEELQLDRELRIAPSPDHRGIHLAIWCEASPKMNRTENLLDDLAAHNVDPMFTDDLDLGKDLALWYGMSFSTRRHGAEQGENPPGYDNYRRGSAGQILRVRAWGDKRDSKGYSSPFRRQAEADAFGKDVMHLDAPFPAFRKRTVSGDDYSQWFGLDYSRHATEGFRNRYGFDAPTPAGCEDPYGTPNIDRAPGIIPDNDPWLLVNRYWSETLGDAGRRLSRAMEGATGGTGKVGPVPGGMQLPVISMWSGQYPPFNFGTESGFNLSCFYYYNSYWQPPLTHIWWLESARMGNRDIEQWIMPDCYQFHLQSFYGNNLWLILAGNAKGLPCFYYPGRKPAALQALKEMGVFTRRYGLLLEKLRPAPKRVAFLVPFENVTFRIEHGFEMAYSFLNLLLAKIDVEPVSPEELDAVSIMNYEAVVLAHTKWLKADTVKLLEDYLSAGGNVILDSVTTAAIPVKGAVQLDFPLAVGGATIREYGRIEAIDKVRAAILPVSSPVVDCDNPLVAVRRALLPDGTPAVWLVHNYSQDEYARLRAGRDSNPEAARALEASLGYRQETVTATVLREDDGRIPFDLVDRQVLDCKRADGMMHIDVAMSKWEGKLLLFLPALPDQLELTGIPDETVPGLPVNIGVYVRDSSNALFDAPVPLQLSVRDPDGRENREYSRRLLAENGSVRHSFSFATNDRRGHWTIEVENQLTGAKISRQIRCRPH